jgi:hypothetical protein
MKRLTIMALLLASVAACGEKDQSLATTVRRDDQKSFEGQKTAYTAKNYEPGDKVRWETQLRTRAQAQNEYNKTN